MRNRRLWHYPKFILLAVIFAGVGAPVAVATTSNSTNYQVTETQFGSGSLEESCSGQYCAQASIGDTVAGTSESSGNSATFGSVTPGEPLLEVIVDPGESNLGVLTTERTATKTTSVQIRNYLSSGYTLQIVGSPPKYGNHSLKTLTTPAASDYGNEQFGINAAANTIPSVGATPVQIPSDQMSFGIVEQAYRTPNLFKYVSGDVIARSETESGQTNYTISMIVNIASTTPAGHYTGDLSAVVIPVF